MPLIDVYLYSALSLGRGYGRRAYLRGRLRAPAFFFRKACGSSHSSPMRFDMSIPPSSKPIRSSPIETNSLWSFKTPMLPPKD